MMQRKGDSMEHSMEQMQKEVMESVRAIRDPQKLELVARFARRLSGN